MPSVRVKKGYRNLDSFNHVQTRSRALSAPQADLPQEFELEATPHPPGRSWSSGAETRLSSRPRARSKISSHILSRRRPSSATSIPEGSNEGPSHVVHSGAHRHSHHLLRRNHDTYVAEGQQADLRVPNNGYRDLNGSQINLALRQLEGEDFDHPDSEDEHHHDDIVEHLDVIGACFIPLQSP